MCEANTDSPHYNTAVQFLAGEGWGFWDETWTTFYGGYLSEETARTALERYCNWLMTGDDDCLDEVTL